MDQHRDEQITCASCGNSFLFSAADAKARAERGLNAPPKFCKDCHRARKERERNQGGEAADARSRSSRSLEKRARIPHHTGDVNEYRSPMQDGYSARDGAMTTGDVNEYRSPMQVTSGPSPTRSNAFRQVNGAQRRDRRFRSSWLDDGSYRAPSFGHSTDASGARGAMRSGGPRMTRDAGPARTYSNVCKACSKAAEVPFKPAENRDVFCQDCYRARKPS